MEILKEYNTIEFWTLIVAIATFIVTCLSYRYNRKSAKRNVRKEIQRKEAQLKAMETSSQWGVEYSMASYLRVEMAALRAEIEQLKEQL